MKKYLDGDGLKYVGDRFQNDLDEIDKKLLKKADAIVETYGPSDEVIIDIASEGSFLNPFSEIDIVDEGEGEPSPDNPHSISGRNGIRLLHNDSEFTQEFPEEIYGGIYDWSSGILRVSNKFYSFPIETISDNDTYPSFSNIESLLECFELEMNRTAEPLASNIGKRPGINTLNRNRTLFLPYNQYHLTGVEWKTNYPGLVVQFVFPLLEPYTIELPSRDFFVLTDKDRLSSDCGKTYATFQLDFKKYIDKRLNEFISGGQE